MTPGGDVVSVQIRRDLSGPEYLGPNGWHSEKHWIAVQGAREDGDDLAFELDPEITKEIPASSNIEILVSADGAAAFGSAHLIWPAIQQRSTRSGGGRRISIGGGRAKEPEQPPEPQLPAPPPAKEDDTGDGPVPTDGTGSGDDTGQTGGGSIAGGAGRSRFRRFMPWVLVGSGVVALVAAGLFLLLFYEATPPVTPPPPPPKLMSLNEVREGIAKGMSAEESLEEAERQLGAGNAGAAFLLFKQASKSGAAGGYLGMARMYDPALHSKATSALQEPNAARAVELYERAAEQGEVFAMRRLGMLLYDGAESVPADQPAARIWLEKAAGKGDGEARSFLEERRKT